MRDRIKRRRKYTYADVAVNISTFLARVIRLRHSAKHAVKITRMARRAGMLETKYSTIIEDMGRRDARIILTAETIDKTYLSE